MLKPLSFTIATVLCWSWAVSTANSQASILYNIGRSPAAIRVIGDLVRNPALAQKALALLGRAPEPGINAAETLLNLSAVDRGALILGGDSLGLSKSFLSHSGLDTSRYSIENWTLKLNDPIQFNLPGRGSFKLNEIDLKAPAATIGTGTATGLCSLSETCSSRMNQILNRIAPGDGK